ncbi:MAG: glycosyltransferase family 39 protein [Desulfovibrionaceae bacterium]|nr:glycosyltransferase family 39 protein [Desulfovibrionaceae bacterium]
MAPTPSRVFSRLANHPWLTMTLAVLAQTWFALGNRALWFSDEVRYADAYKNLVLHGKWMVLSLNGQPYPDKPPVYFWFLWLIDTLTPADMPQVFFIGAALSGLFFLFAAYWLARTLGHDRNVSLASTLVLLSTFFLAALFHYSRMDLLFTALIVLAHGCLYRAFTGERQGKWPLLAFLCGGVATLIKGPLGFLFPLLTAAVWLVWRGEPKKLFSRQMGLGLLAMLALLGAWVAGVILAEGPDFLLDTVLGKHVIQRATHTFHHREGLWYYFAALPLAWLPWTLAAFAVPVRRYLSPAAWREIWAGRRSSGKHAFPWIMFAATFVFLSSLSGKVLIYILPMFPPLAILTADFLLNGEARRVARLWTLAAAAWITAGVALLVAGDMLPFPVPLRGLGISACVLLLGGGALLLVRSKGGDRGLLTAALALTVWLYPVGLLVAPSLDDAMSPKRQALIIKSYADQGYEPHAMKVYSGIFAYYSGYNLIETNHLDELVRSVENKDRVVLSVRESQWKHYQPSLPGFRIVDRQYIAGMVYLVAVKG